MKQRHRSRTPVRRRRPTPTEPIVHRRFKSNDTTSSSDGTEPTTNPSTIQRTPGAKPSDIVHECDLHYENFSVDNIYERWDAIVPEQQRDRLEHFAVYLADQDFADEPAALFKRHMKLGTKRFKLLPRKALLLHVYRYMLADGRIQQENPHLERLLVTKSSKSQSGVLVITVLTSPYPTVGGKKQRFSCEWNCYYCPDQPGQPRSYLRDEPAVLRANQNGFDAVCQFTDRAAVLAQNGHPIDKIELLVLGGTWTSYPLDYRESFVRDLYFAANTFFTRNKRERCSLQEEILLNETAKCKIIGLTLETRPDTICTEELWRLRSYGCTRVQLGVQHTSDAILDKINRRCSTQQTIDAIRMLKDACYKIDIHLMPNLPGSTPAIDKAMFDNVLTNPDLQVDQWKIYPCEITPWTVIKKWHEQGKFIPYSDEELIELLIHVKSRMHPWIRLNRVVRDIPTQYIDAGIDAPNLREDILAEMKRRGLCCPCIRCREIGSEAERKRKLAKPHVREYVGSGAQEYFISYETEALDRIFGFLRLRIPPKSHTTAFPELVGCALVRELHVYGQLVEAGKKSLAHSQHVGYGRKMMAEAERTARKHGLSKVAVIAGVGTRSYYRKLGYELDPGKGQFMIKHLGWTEGQKAFVVALLVVVFGAVLLGFAIPEEVWESIEFRLIEIVNVVVEQFRS